MNDSNEPDIQAAVLAAILENAVDAIINITTRGIIDSVNPAAEVMFGFTAKELIGNNIKMLMPNPDRDQHDQYMANYLTSGKRKIIGIGREVIGRRKDGTTFPMHLAVSEIRVGDRHLFTGIVRDISEQKEAEKRLAEANGLLEDRVRQRTSELRATQADLVRSEKFATLGKVSGGIAHEIRNPLNAVKTSAYYLLNAKSPSEEKTKEHLERIDRQVTMIDNVVTALSDVAKLPDARLKPVELKVVIKSALASLSLPGNIEVALEIEQDLSLVMVDANQFAIVLKNLIRNARDAMPGGGKLTIGASNQEDSVAIYVSDTGVGISREHLSKILEPLFTTKARGMGLGLSISRAIVEKNKGTLSVTSELGEGSTFLITLRRHDG